MDPATLTVEGVARKVGVDHKTIRYHVRDRQGLLELVATELYISSVQPFDPPLNSDWRDLLRVYGSVVMTNLGVLGPFAAYVRLDERIWRSSLEPADRVVQALLDAGFDDTDVGKILDAVTSHAASAARDEALARSNGMHPFAAEGLRVLQQLPEDELPALRRAYAAAEPSAKGRLEFVISTLIAGLEQALLGRRSGTPSPRRRRLDRRV